MVDWKMVAPDREEHVDHLIGILLSALPMAPMAYRVACSLGHPIEFYTEPSGRSSLLLVNHLINLRFALSATQEHVVFPLQRGFSDHTCDARLPNANQVCLLAVYFPPPFLQGRSLLGPHPNPMGAVPPCSFFAACQRAATWQTAFRSHSRTHQTKPQPSELEGRGRPLSRRPPSFPRTSFPGSECRSRSHRTATLFSSGISASEMARQPLPCGGLRNSTGPAGTAS